MVYEHRFTQDNLDQMEPALILGAPEEPETHILFIGGDPAVAAAYRLKLKLDGYQTSVVTSERKAQTLAASLKPDLIYLDLASASNWGLKVLSGIRKSEATRSTPVLLLVKFPGCEQPMLGPHDFPAPLRLALLDRTSWHGKAEA